MQLARTTVQPSTPTHSARHPASAPCPIARSWLAAGLLAASAAAGAAEPQKTVLDAATARKEESIALLQRLVNMDSGTLDIKGVEQVRSVVTDELQKLGGRVETVPEDGRGATSSPPSPARARARSCCSPTWTPSSRRAPRRPAPSASTTTAPMAPA